jgi:benzoate transport
MRSDPREIINQSEMSILQMLVIAIMVGLNSLDGFDILSISFASPGIAKEWGVDRTALGIILSMELVGMGLGSFFLGSLADKIGRRPTALYCLTVMAIGMFMVTTTTSIYTLMFWRIFTGVGIGGLLTAITALSAEFSSLSRRHLSISLMAIGYPLGGVVGGIIASRLLADYDWRSVFYLGASITAFFIPVVYFLVPESIHYLVRDRKAGALEKINKTLNKCKHPSITVLPQITDVERRKSVGDIFSPGMLKNTVIICITYFLHITTYYFILKWVPKIVADMGFAISSASGVLVWANVGGALGGAIFGLLTLKFNLKKLAVAILFFAAVFIAIFGQTPADLKIISLLCMMVGFFGNSGIIALYAIVAHTYPTHARAFGTGFMLAVGRGGAIASPIMVGFMLQHQVSLSAVGMIMSIGSLVGAALLLLLKLKSGDSQTASSAEESGKNPGAASKA